jgi:Ca-activated chloride channel homolog
MVRSRLPLIIGVCLGLVAIGVIYLVLRPDTPSNALDQDDCVRIEISSSTEKGDLLAEIADGATC